MIRFIGPFAYSAVRALAFEQYMFALIFIIPGYVLCIRHLLCMSLCRCRDGGLCLPISSRQMCWDFLYVFSLYMIGEPDFSRLTVYIFCVDQYLYGMGSQTSVFSVIKDMRKRGLNQKQILLVGYSRAAEEYIDRISRIHSGVISSVESWMIMWQREPCIMGSR